MTNYYASYPISSGGTSIAKYATLAAFPLASSVSNGTLAIALDTDTLYISTGTVWEPIASPGDALSIGTFDSGVASANGAHIDTNQLIMQSASTTVPGLVNTATQNFTGIKSFASAMAIGTTAPGSKLVVKGAGATSATSSLNVTDSASTSLLFVEDDGKVGIGTIAPQAPLHVIIGSGALGLRIGDAANTNYLDFVTGGLETRFIATGNRPMAFYTNSTEQMRIDGAGKVGIGTTGPGSQLEVKGAGATSATSSLNVTSSSGTSLLFVRDDGNIGIGTATPGAKLEVNGLISASPGVSNTRGVTFFDSNYGMGIDSTDLVLWSNASTGISFKDNANSGYNGNLLMRVLGSGRVGIGISTPGSQLEVKGAGATAATSSLNVTNSSSTSLLFVQDDGKVGIGTATPPAKLTVTDNIGAGGDATFPGVIQIASNGGTTGSVGGLEFKVATAGSGFGFRIAAPDLGTGETPLYIQRRSSSATWTNALTILGTSGAVGIGTATPGAALEVNGQIKITGGTPGSGKVLTSDSVGLATWTTPTTGTVTSVAMTVPTFLSVSGSPVTSSGTLAVTLSGTALPILNGGTGQTTANAALNAFLPTQTSNSGKALTTDGSNTAWSSVLTNPMTTAGDIIVGGIAGAPARLAIGASTTVLLGGSTPSYGQVTSSQVNSTVFSTNQASAAPAGATTIGTTDPSVQLLTPSADFSLKLDNTYVAGRIVTVVNLSTTKIITVIANAGATIRTVYPTTSAQFICTSTSPTIPGSWACPGRVTSDWIAYTPTVTGMTLGTVQYCDYYRSGPNLNIKALITTSTVTASALQVTFPSGATYSNASFSLLAGMMGSDSTGGTNSIFSAIVTNSVNTKVQFSVNNGSSVFTPLNGNQLMGNGNTFGFQALNIPITGWAETTG